MGLSANTIFHFTSDYNSLKSIIQNGLYVRYSLENYHELISIEDAEIAFPMTCFCDIPLSQIKNHTETYGKYAIGLSKEWGIAKQISPVVYSYPNSATAELLNELVNNLNEYFNITKEEMSKLINAIEERDSKKIGLQKSSKYKSDVHNKLARDLQNGISDFIRYIKPYTGKAFRGNSYLRNKILFYDEREWRFTPRKQFFKDKDLKDSYSSEYYKDTTKRRAINLKLAKYLKLNFAPSDVKFIIVENENEIPSMLKFLENVFENHTTQKELRILGTRLISLNQIINDI